MLGGVFISYRREDSGGFAGRIYDRLTNKLGRESVFFDVDNIAPGLDFFEVLSERVGRCDALVAVIGTDWISSVDKDNRRRLDDADDFVRIEIEAALSRGVRVIPVLVDGATMPKREDLPDSLKKLARRQGIEISHTRFDSDVERLTRALALLEAELRQREAAEQARLDAEADVARRAAEARRAEEERRARELAQAERASSEEREKREAEAARAEEARQKADAEAMRRVEGERRAREAAEAELAAGEEREKEEARRASPPDAPAAGSRSDAPTGRPAEARFPTRDAVSGESQRDGPEVELSAAIWLLGDRRWQVAAIAALLTIIAALALTFGRPGPRLTVSKPEPAPVTLSVEPDATISKAAPEPTTSGAVPEPTVSKAEPESPIHRLALPGFEAIAPTPSDGAGTEIPDDAAPHMREWKALQKQVEEQLLRLNSPASDGAGKHVTYEDVTRQMEKLNALRKQVDQELDGQNQAAMAAIREINGRSDAEAPAQQWLARADFDAKVKQQFAAGNYPDKAWGRCENGAPQAAAHWSARPPGQDFSYYGTNDHDFNAKNAELVAKGYVLQYDNWFPNCDGSTRHQALWMKGR